MDPVKILVVDDEPDILEFLEYNLKKEGYKVICLSSGEECVAVAKAERVGLVILDLMLPGIDGSLREAGEHLRLAQCGERPQDAITS